MTEKPDLYNHKSVEVIHCSGKRNEQGINQKESEKIIEDIKKLISILKSVVTKIKNGDSKTGPKTREDIIKEHVRSGHKKIKTIFHISEKIKDEKVSEKIHKICITARKIYDNLEKYLHDINAARLFLNYYIDVTVKLVAKYKELSRYKIDVPDVNNALNKLEDILDLIQKGFDKQLSKLFEDDILNLDIEIKVLKKALETDGLAVQ